MSIIQTTKSWAIVIGAAILVAAVFVVGYMALLDGTVVNPVTRYESTTFQVDKDIYRPGETVLARAAFIKGRNLKGTMKWNLVNHRVIPYASKEISLPLGIHDVWFPVEQLPTTGCSSGGEYHFEGIVEYQVNPIRRVTYKIGTEAFRITPAE